VLVDHGQLERNSLHRPEAADSLEESQVLLETAERNVLAVVRRWIRIALPAGERLELSTERRPGFEEGDLVACIHEVKRGRQTGKTAADNGRLHRRSPEPTIRSFVSADR
jgi:hypothetical protein